MAYNRENHLRKIIEIQELYVKLKKQGLFTRTIHKEHIYPKYFITISTLYTYLATPAKRDLKRIISKKQQ